MLDGQTFPEVFPDFRIPDDLRYTLSNMIVTKVVMRQQDRQLIVHLKGEHVIGKKLINKIAYDLKTQLFGKTQVFLTIDDTYELSPLYTLEQLTRDYWNSILYEVRRMGQVEYSLLKKSEWGVEGDILTLLLEDSFLARKKARELKEYLESMYAHRFGKEIQVGFNFTEDAKNAFYRARDHKLNLEVGLVMDQVRKAEAEKGGSLGEGTGEDVGAANGLDNPDGNLSGSGQAKDVKPRRQYSGNFFEERARRQEFSSRRRSKDPEVIYGRDCDGEIVPISEIVDEIGQVVIRGKIMNIELREIRRERTIVSFAITDFTDSILGKIFLKNDQLPDFLGQFEKGRFYKIKGLPKNDTFEHDITLTSIEGIKPIPDFTVKRMDKSLEKRVELHLHTVMSDLDSVVDIGQAIKTAKEWGHKAVAITDHGVLQAFPIANHCISMEEPFKILYGVEGYFVDDLKTLVVNAKEQTLMDDYVVFDLETTGFSPVQDEIIEIGAVKVRAGKVTDHYSVFVNPGRPIPPRITELTSIDDSMVADAPGIEVILPEFLAFCRGCSLVAHNADFDVSFIEEKAVKLGLSTDFTVLDTVQMARLLLTDLNRFKLNTVCKYLGIKQEHHHRAVDDARVTAEVFIRFIEMLDERNVHTVADLNEMGRVSPDLIKKSMTYHGIILVKNETGRVNLNRLVSASHLDYFNRRPRMPKSLIEKYREGLILGSACEAGELFQAIIKGKSEEEIARIVRFYDYLEIQPLSNNRFMIESDRYDARSDEDLKDYNRRIVELGERYNKPVVATCDVHFLNPEDELYRRILQAGKGFADADRQAELYFRTTEEMLEEFSYLGEDKAMEVVVTNTNKIADMIEKISPVHPKKCPPVIPDSDRTLTEICYKKAHEIYGPDLPEIVEERLSRELNSIISNGFAVMYIIAQKLVWDSNDHGYLVGSRGSVGSSFVATMSGITEVNPLSAHYICPKCHFVDFDSEYVKPYTMKGMSGCDMPDRDCPVCGTRLIKEGHDIPFETFLGFKGNKEPDIDLNFSGEYQGKAHKYVEVIFGEGSAFRAGTIGTIADKTAYGYVMKYFEERGIHKRRCEIERIAQGCTGVKRTTGQHPGGIIVVPHEHEIYEFTAIQHPANDVNTDIVTTHFEYHSIDHNLLKLDILGHDDPTMIRRLEDLTGIDAKTIPLDDPDVMSLFHGTQVMGIRPEDIGGVELGSMGVPEFGTEFVMQMLKDTNPQCFSDLVRISGLSHGTDVWLGNAQTLIENGQAEISTAICCRDDIMTYLINMGLDKEQSFTIMEAVRKGKGLKPDWEEEMLSHGVPDWYIWSCKKIKYMFPKAHAAAYVMMGWRVAWYKVHHPVAYYAAFFAIRASAFSYEIMCRGPERLAAALEELQKTPKDQQTKKDQDTIRDGRIVQEMYARGISFVPIDIYKAKARECLIIDETHIMPPISSVEGLGDKACEQVEEAARRGSFTSLDNFREQAKVSKTNVEKMVELGILKGLPESDQLTFDFFLAGQE
ncbi:MAG: PolC-type DNA polymerase III [Eubacterium sp.]|nr:PolC-type DNA polymerase III [Eubacterium sp.]